MVALARGRRFYFAVLLAILAKLALAVTTTLGSDYVGYLSAAVNRYPDVSWSPWIVYVKAAYDFWISLPIIHGDIQTIMTGSLSMFSGAMVLAALVKAPIILSDILSAVVLFKLSTRLLISENLGRRIAVLWLVNPLVTLLGEMCGSIDVILVFLTLVSLYLLLEGRRVLGAAALTCAIALRLSPIAVWPVFAIWVFRNRSQTRSDFAVALAGPLGVCAYLFWLTRGMMSSVLDMQLWTILGFLPLHSIGAAYSAVTQSFVPYLGFSVFIGYIGLAVLAVPAAYALAMESWPMGRWGAVYLIPVGFLILLALGVWQPSALLWALPYLLLSYLRSRNTAPYLVLYHIVATASLILFYGVELTTSGLSFLFWPKELVPFSKLLISGLQYSLPMSTLTLIRSLTAGFLIAYALLLYWKGLGDRWS